MVLIETTNLKRIQQKHKSGELLTEKELELLHQTWEYYDNLEREHNEWLIEHADDIYSDTGTYTFLKDLEKELKANKLDIERKRSRIIYSIRKYKGENIYDYVRDLLTRDYEEEIKYLEFRLQDLLKHLVKAKKPIHITNSLDNSNWKASIEKAKKIPVEVFVDTKKAKRTSNKLLVSCPIHDDKTPSCALYLDNNTFYCFGCHKGGDVINLYQAIHGVDFKEAVKALNNIF